MQKYQVLARKYRPQRFSEMVGQEAVVATLKNAIRFQKVAHAYLFAGSRGVGKTTLARLFAKALNCQAPSADLEPCNTCVSCTSIINGQSLDVIEIDGASNRGIDDIRKINETVGYAPTYGRFKIYIIDEVHMLTKEAFNALLKTLEEPPETAKFFFATTEAHKVLPTILSRCQRFDLTKIPLPQITAKLDQIATDLGRSVEKEALHQIALLAEGSLRDAESLFDQILCFLEGSISIEAVQTMFGIVSQEQFLLLDRAFHEGNLHFAFSLVEQLTKEGKDLGHFLSQLIEHYRSLTLYKTLGEGAVIPSLISRYAQTAPFYLPSQCLYILEYLLNAEATFSKSLSQRIFLETILLHILRSKQRLPVEVLVRRLSEIEESLRSDKPSGALPLQSSPIAAAPQPKLPEAPPVAMPQPKVAIPPQVKSPEAPPQPKLPETPPIAAAPQPKLPEATPVAIPQPKAAIPPQVKSPEAPPKAKLPAIEASSPSHHPSHYDTIMRFAAVELEGSLKLN